MRQAGMIAAAALYALDHHVSRLAEDHLHAQMIAGAVREASGLKLVPSRVETNLIWFEVSPTLGTAKDVAAELQQRGILVQQVGSHTMRACTHLDVSAQMAEKVVQEIPRVMDSLRGKKAATGG